MFCLLGLILWVILDARYSDEVSSLLSEIEKMRAELSKLSSTQAVRAGVALPLDEDSMNQIINQQKVSHGHQVRTY